MSWRCSCWEPDTEAGRQFLANLPFFFTYTLNWFLPLEGRVIFYFAWSLATEEQFYATWPTLEKVLRGWNAVWLAMGMLALCEAWQAAAHRRAQRRKPCPSPEGAWCR